MDYAERGTVEKTLDRLIEESAGLGTVLEADIGDLIEQEELTAFGRAYTTGLLSGILATVQTFSDGNTEFTDEDVEELRRIVDSRSGELVAILSDGGEGAGSSD